jgi:hypothetical protein
MSRIPWSAAGLAAVTTAGLLAATTVVPERRLGLLDADLLVVGGLALVAAFRAARVALPPAPITTRRRPADAPARPAELERLERQVLFAETSGLDAHRLRVILREVAVYRLATNHAVDLVADPAAAELLLGPELWAAVGPQPSRPADRDGPRLDPAELGRLLDALERM